MKRLIFVAIYLVCVLLAVPAALPARAAVTVTGHDVDTLVSHLDQLLAHRNKYISQRRQRIKTLSLTAEKEGTWQAVEALADAYVGYAPDSAILFMNKAIALTAEGSGERNVLRARLAALYPLAGLVSKAQETLDSVDTSAMTPQQVMDYEAAGVQAYYYMGIFYYQFPETEKLCRAKEAEIRAMLLRDTPEELRDQAVYHLALGNYYMEQGQLDKAETLFVDVLDTEPVGSSLGSRAAELLSMVMWQRKERQAHAYYLMKAACNDLLAGDTDALPLFKVAEMMSGYGKMELAIKYYNAAIDYAPENHDFLSLMESGRYAPVVTHSYEQTMHSSRRWAVAMIIVAVILMVVIVVLIVRLRRKGALLRRNMASVQELHNSRNEYLARFMDLCAIYVTRLTQFTSTVESKIRAGKADELLRLIRAGKVSPDHSADFFRIFDRAFLRIYPDFVSQVNELMQSDQQLEPDSPDALSTDLRILAFMRLGMRDTSQIAQMMGYSVNTLYAYRTRLRNRAISRDTFEADLVSIPLSR